MTHDVFGDDARDEELQQVIAAAGFRSAARHLESAERMAANDRAGAGAIDVNIARDQLRFDALRCWPGCGRKILRSARSRCRSRRGWLHRDRALE